ncbi:hypothetical protein B0H10DRAFT_2019194 [Mycena sp. CBHHK59/15]|nr:hypothetical protein B0H10DRAFT_2019194 [Mycena sp. CBHHK59/15]
MLGSWFPQSTSTPEATQDAGANPLPGGHNQRPGPAETLPHDRILGNLLDHAKTDSQASLSHASAIDSANSVYDPFDGSFLGFLVPPDQNVLPEGHGKSNYAAAKNEELWSHLSRVLELQNQISHMHLDMEEIGMNASDTKGKGKGTRSRAASVSRVVSDDIEGEEGIGGKRDEEAERNKAREEQFAKLSGQFRGRKEAIDGIMTKLDALSRAVTEFHALQAPKIDIPSSRHNSLPVTNTAPEPTEKSAPFDMTPLSTSTAPKPSASATPLKRVDESGNQTRPALVESPISTVEMSLPP